MINWFLIINYIVVGFIATTIMLNYELMETEDAKVTKSTLTLVFIIYWVLWLPIIIWRGFTKLVWWLIQDAFK